jgi:hypothetical protein
MRVSGIFRVDYLNRDTLLSHHLNKVARDEVRHISGSRGMGGALFNSRS